MSKEMAMNFIEDLKWRGALNQVTDEAGLIEAMASGEIGGLCRYRSNS